ncbi:hypothetical protein GGR42_000067 [Saonia flava]|uniref:VWFA domain-containing protein n=1 Tax=Saonia flava TaxID=523696 RepID=A0A846QVL8_9FLAO|nr:vWA domain-containing protein [Saonia flava]NJB69605.1 hypothetical protein [Saonia flava]
MKNYTKVLLVALGFIFMGCDSSSAESDPTVDGIYSDEGESSLSFSGEGSGGSGTSGGSGNQEGEAGLVTAAEWNDLDNWTFWSGLLESEEFKKMPSYWSFYNNNRISVLVRDNTGAPVHGSKVELIKDDNLVWTARTDNFGKAELFIGFRQEVQSFNIEEYSLKVNDRSINTPVKLFSEGINEIMDNTPALNDRVELSFVVDATGSMSDELEFLKKDLLSVIERVKSEIPNAQIFTSSVFYRDEQDEYVVKQSGFTGDANTTLNFIKAQSADGGGDYPEAVHSALDETINKLQWSSSAKTRIAFLLLDAPPHYNTIVVESLQNSIETAAAKGIKIIPISASGVDKETEFVLRFFSISTNGTYVFITNDSGVGNDHIEASVGEYQVEKLNDLMVRLIVKYINGANISFDGE